LTARLSQHPIVRLVPVAVESARRHTGDLPDRDLRERARRHRGNAATLHRERLHRRPVGACEHSHAYAPVRIGVVQNDLIPEVRQLCAADIHR
jgi:hypothetical protein